jgi:hypothetical protein
MALLTFIFTIVDISLSGVMLLGFGVKFVYDAAIELSGCIGMRS